MTYIKDFAQQIMNAKTIEEAHALAYEYTRAFELNLETMPTNGIFNETLLLNLSTKIGHVLEIDFHLVEQVRINRLDFDWSVHGHTRNIVNCDVLDEFETWFSDQVCADDRDAINDTKNIAQLLIAFVGLHPSEVLLSTLGNTDLCTWTFMSSDEQIKIFGDWENFVQNPETFDLTWELDVNEGLDS